LAQGFFALALQVFDLFELLPGERHGKLSVLLVDAVSNCFETLLALAVFCGRLGCEVFVGLIFSLEAPGFCEVLTMSCREGLRQLVGTPVDVVCLIHQAASADVVFLALGHDRAFPSAR
jgi:hypothetical protein